MDKKTLAAGLRKLERRIVEQLDKIDITRTRLLHLIEGEVHDREPLESVASVLHEDVSQLRELYQEVIYKTTLLTSAEGGDD
jgi:hypothetical protein